MRVFVRKRPLFEYEAARGEYNVISIVVPRAGGRNGDGGGARVVVHNCVMHADMKRMYHHALWFPCDVAIDESASEDDVYRLCAAPLVRAATTPRGGVATLFCYGQTGRARRTQWAISRRAPRRALPLPMDDGGGDAALGACCAILSSLASSAST